MLSTGHTDGGGMVPWCEVASKYKSSEIKPVKKGARQCYTAYLCQTHGGVCSVMEKGLVSQW